jgi:hypothetical protein
MTRRERLENKLRKRQEWAESRQRDADRCFEAAHKATENIPLGQPILVGHHSENGHRAALARSDSNMAKGCESLAMAEHHEAKAGGIEHQLENSVFSDDGDAVEQLEARIAEREAKRERMKKINAAHKRFVEDPASLDAADLTEAEKKAIREYVPAYSWEPHPFPPYSFQNLGASIRRDKERIEDIKRRTVRAAKAEQAGGVVVEETGEWCRVTFAEKPDRSVLGALKAAGFHWGAGSWSGKTAQLPACVKKP